MLFATCREVGEAYRTRIAKTGMLLERAHDRWNILLWDSGLSRLKAHEPGRQFTYTLRPICP